VKKFALLAIAVTVAVGGCQEKPSKPTPQMQGYVRLGALIALHPAWTSVKQIEQMMAEVKKIPIPLESPPLVLGEGKLPPLLPASPGQKAERTPQRQRIIRLARERMEDLQAWLDIRNARLLLREQQAQQNELEADVARFESALREKARTEAEALRKKVREHIRNLQLQQVAYRSQVAALSGEPRIAAEARLTAIKNELEAAQGDLSNRLTAISHRVEQEVRQYRANRQVEAATQWKNRREEMEQETKQMVARYEAQLSADLARIDPLALPPVPSLPSAKEPGKSTPPADASTSMPSFQPKGVQKLLAGLAAQRERLLRLLSEDVRQRVQQLAVENHWKITLEPKPGLDDITLQVAEQLRGAWQPGSISIP